LEFVYGSLLHLFELYKIKKEFNGLLFQR